MRWRGIYLLNNGSTITRLTAYRNIGKDHRMLRPQTLFFPIANKQLLEKTKMDSCLEWEIPKTKQVVNNTVGISTILVKIMCTLMMTFQWELLSELPTKDLEDCTTNAIKTSEAWHCVCPTEFTWGLPMGILQRQSSNLSHGRVSSLLKLSSNS